MKSLKRLTAHGMLAIPFGTVCAVHGMIAIGVALQLLGHRPLGTLDTWYAPLVWWPGLLLGFFVNRRTLHGSACFVWLAGLVWLAVGMLIVATSWRPAGVPWTTYVSDQLFPLQRDACGTIECLRVMFCTWPAVNSVAYSVGAAIALLFPRETEELSRAYTTLGLE